MNTIVGWISKIVRWIIEGWQVAPARNRIGAAICMAVLIGCFVALAIQIGGFAVFAFEVIWKPKPEAVRTSAWLKTQPLLEEADRFSASALNRHLSGIHAFLDERKAGTRAFAERMVGLQGKWETLKAQIGYSSEFAVFLSEAFAEHVFPMQELEKVVSTSVRSYLAELEAIDDDLLVRLRADLSDDELPRLAIPALRSDEALRRHYHELSQRVTRDLSTDLAVVAAREFFIWHASNIATDLTLQVGAAIASRLGLSTTLLAAGAESTWQTLGVGLVVCFVLDAVINRIIKATGYDAEEQIAARVDETLSALGRTITDGDPEARDRLEQLNAMQYADPNEKVRAACARAIASIQAGTQLYGLKGELTKIGAARASVRKETLRRLIQESE